MKRILIYSRICYCLSLVGAAACPILFGWKGVLIYIWTFVWTVCAGYLSGYWFAKQEMAKAFTEQIEKAEAQVVAATKESAAARAKVDEILALLSAKQKAN